MSIRSETAGLWAPSSGSVVVKDRFDVYFLRPEDNQTHYRRRETVELPDFARAFSIDILSFGGMVTWEE